jgi:integrase
MKFDDKSKEQIEYNFELGQKLKKQFKAFTEETETFIDTVKERNRRYEWYKKRKVDKNIYDCLTDSEVVGITDYEFFARMFAEYVRYKNDEVDFSLIDKFDRFDFPPENGKPLRYFGYRKNPGEPEFREKELLKFEKILFNFIRLAQDNYQIKLKCIKQKSI